MTQASVQSENTRFQQLLAPIRDLTENWNIDLASQLEEYLEEIGQIEITFDNGRTKIDFVQAALLIQGSAQVFSRKVEYLYSLVVQTLELLTSQETLEDKNTSLNQTVRLQQPVFDLLTLDDVPTRVSELKEESAVRDRKLIAETPTVLLPTYFSQTTPLFSTTKEVVGQRQDFHLLTATPHNSGTLLLEPNLAHSLARQPDTFNNTIPQQQFSLVHDGGYNDENEDDCDVTPYNSPPSRSPATPHRLVGTGSTRPSNTVLTILQSGSLTADKLAMSQNPFSSALNPYDPPTGEVRPFKRGKSYRLPPALTATAVPGKRRREVQTVSEALLDHLTTNLWSERKHFPKNSLLKLSFLPLEEMFWLEQKRRDDELKELHKIAALQRSRDSCIPLSQFYSQLATPAGDGDSDGEEPECLPDELPDNENEPDLPPQDLPNFEVPNEPLYLPSFTEQNDGASQPGIAGYARKVRLYLDEMRHKAQKHAHTTALSTRVEEWRRYVSPILEREANETVFDIREASLSLVSRIKSHPDRTIEWKDFTQGMAPHEVACNFLTSLVLANNYNIQLGSDKGNLTISLLDDKLAFEEVAHFIAPSLDD